MKHKHNWKPLYNRPTEADSPERRVDYLFLREDADNLICTECGRVGYPSKGQRKGGGHKIKLLPEDLTQNAIDRAEKWNNS